MIINIAIHKAFIRHDLVNKLFITKMFLAERVLIFVKACKNKNKFVQIKSKKGKA